MGCIKQCTKGLAGFLPFGPCPMPSLQGTDRQARSFSKVLACAAVLNKFPSTTPGAVSTPAGYCSL
jgi:hypothetical protein